MLAFGAFLSCAAVLALAMLALVFRRPAPPRWTTRSWSGELISVAIVAAFATGLGYFTAGAWAAYQGGSEMLDLGLLALVLLATVMVWRRLDLRQRLKSMEAATTASAAVARGGAGRRLSPAATAELADASVTPPEPPPSRPRRRAAA